MNIVKKSTHKEGVSDIQYTMYASSYDYNCIRIALSMLAVPYLANTADEHNRQNLFYKLPEVVRTRIEVLCNDINVAY